MSKVTVVGAGNVGATCANVIATREIADELVLLDIKEGVSDRKSTRLNSSHNNQSRMPSSA